MSELSSNMVRIAEIEIDPEHAQAYYRLLSEEIEASVRLEPDVLSLQAIAQKDAPWKIVILEIYANQAAYEAHIQTPHFLKYKSMSAHMVRSLNLIDGVPVCMHSKQG